MSDDPILSALARLEAGQAALRADQPALRADFFAELGKTRGAIMEKVERLENAVTAIRDDIAVSMGASEAMQRANDNTRADLRTLSDQMSIMWKQLKQVQTDVREIRGDP